MRLPVFTEVLQSGDYTANRHFAKSENACVARVVIFTNWAFGGLNAQFAKARFLSEFFHGGCHEWAVILDPEPKFAAASAS
jgi:hypothetical protein